MPSKSSRSSQTTWWLQFKYVPFPDHCAFSRSTYHHGCTDKFKEALDFLDSAIEVLSTDNDVVTWFLFISCTNDHQSRELLRDV